MNGVIEHDIVADRRVAKGLPVVPVHPTAGEWVLMGAGCVAAIGLCMMSVPLVLLALGASLAGAAIA